MRGDDNQQEGIFSHISPEKRVPADHPLRAIRKMVDEILKEMSPKFAKLYSDVGLFKRIDHLYVSNDLYSRLDKCRVGDQAIIFGKSLSDHLPIIADFKIQSGKHANLTPRSAAFFDSRSSSE